MTELSKDSTITDRARIRMELWKDIAVVVARAENATNKSAPGAWANAVLQDFDMKFNLL